MASTDGEASDFVVSLSVSEVGADSATLPEQAPDLGSSVASIAFAEVIPLVLAAQHPTSASASAALRVDTNQPPPSLVAPIIKSTLQQWTLQSTIQHTRDVLNDDGPAPDAIDVPDSQMLPQIGIIWSAEEDAQGLPEPKTPAPTATHARGYLCIKRPKQGSTESTPRQVTMHRTCNDGRTSTSTAPLIFLPPTDPTQLQDVPCVIRLHALRSPNTTCARIVGSTLLRVLPACIASFDAQYDALPPWFVAQQYQQQLLDGTGATRLPSQLRQQVLCNHNEDTVRGLAMRMALQLQRDVIIGTTADALTNRSLQRHRNHGIRAGLRRLAAVKEGGADHNSSNGTAHPVPPSFLAPNAESKSQQLRWEPSLLVHSPQRAFGKTLLVQTLALERLHCGRIHLIAVPALLAKYSVQADAALESLLHSIVISAAAAKQRICVILDHIDALLPPHMSGARGHGDAANPVLNGVANYLQTLTRSIQERNEFTFPTRNKLYNPDARHGVTFKVNMCLVAIVTCPDDGWRKLNSNATSQTTSKATMASSIFDAFLCGRFRVQDLSNATRARALTRALTQRGLSVDPKDVARLAASASWMKGGDFSRIATRLHHVTSSFIDKVPISLLQDVVNSARNKSIRSLKIDFEARPDILPAASPSSSSAAAVPPSSTRNRNSDADADTDGYENASTDHHLFATVGGNQEAKRALSDALALSRTAKLLLRRFRMAAPTGIMLYGPPGTGKTLLAKAVARMLKSNAPHKLRSDDSAAADHDGASLLGGAFISLKSSDIVQAEIGTSEKLVRSAFEVARKNSPSVIFIDEFQALFTERNAGGSSKLASVLLQCMDDIQKWRSIDDMAKRGDMDGADAVAAGGQGYRDGTGTDPNDVDQFSSRIVVLAATNTPWMVDGAFLRAGRFDRVVHVGLPSEDERVSILRVHISRMKIEVVGDYGSCLNHFCSTLAKWTEGFSGADLAALCRAAAVRCVLSASSHDGQQSHSISQQQQQQRQQQQQQQQWDDRSNRVSLHHFEDVMNDGMKASSSPSLVQRLRDWSP